VWLILGCGGVAQLGEHLLCKQGVVGSIPITSTRASALVFECGLGRVGLSSQRRDGVRHGVWDHPRWRGSCASCCSAWWRSGPWIGVLLCCWSFESVNQVLVRLWARLVAATDRMVGLLRDGVDWTSCDRAVCSEARVMC